MNRLLHKLLLTEMALSYMKANLPDVIQCFSQEDDHVCEEDTVVYRGHVLPVPTEELMEEMLGNIHRQVSLRVDVRDDQLQLDIITPAKLYGEARGVMVREAVEQGKVYQAIWQDDLNYIPHIPLAHGFDCDCYYMVEADGDLYAMWAPKDTPSAKLPGAIFCVDEKLARQWTKLETKEAACKANESS